MFSYVTNFFLFNCRLIKKMIIPPETCVICLCNFTLFTKIDSENLQVRSRRVLTICQHVYHLKCIRLWVSINNNCPICQFVDPMFRVVSQMGKWTLDHISPDAAVVAQYPDFRTSLEDVVDEELLRTLILERHICYLTAIFGASVDAEKYVSHYIIPLRFLDD